MKKAFIVLVNLAYRIRYGANDAQVEAAVRRILGRWGISDD